MSVTVFTYKSVEVLLLDQLAAKHWFKKMSVDQGSLLMIQLLRCKSKRMHNFSLELAHCLDWNFKTVYQSVAFNNIVNQNSGKKCRLDIYNDCTTYEIKLLTQYQSVISAIDIPEGLNEILTRQQDQLARIVNNTQVLAKDLF